MSSAILYVAIVVIWAGVLIPRWLRRDNSVAPDTSVQEPEAGESAGESGREEDTAEAEVGERPGPLSRGRRHRPAEASRAEAGRAEAGRAEAGRAEAGRAEAGRAERRPAVTPARDRNRDRARMLSARRRLLGLLVLLAIASGVLAERRLAAWWVVLPPIVMLLGYLGLLREASKADAERLRAERSRTAHGPAAGRSAAAPAGAAPAGAAPAGAASAGVPEVPERRAEVIEISATWEQVEEEELYDQYADAKRRAIGD